jgi:thymidylate synthase
MGQIINITNQTLKRENLNYLSLLQQLKKGYKNKPINISKEPRTIWENTKETAYSISLKNGKMYSKRYDLLNSNNEEISTPFDNIRPLAIKSAINEMIWIYSMKSNRLKDAHELGIKWWDKFEVNNSGTIGFSYGKTVAHYNLINDLLFDMEHNPLSRRHIMNLWQMEHINKQLSIGGLVPCAYETIWNIEEIIDKTQLKFDLETSSNFKVKIPTKHIVHLTLNQRSNDFIVANKINIIQYLALGLMVCGHLTYKSNTKHLLGSITHNIFNLHYYDRHENMLDEILEKSKYDLLNKLISKSSGSFFELQGDKNFFDYKLDDFKWKLPETLKLNSELPIAL